MKKLFLFLMGGLVLASCNNKSASSGEAATDSSATAMTAQKMNYPYTIDHPDNWESGSNQNTMNVLTSLKAYETGNIEESLKYFGDSVHVQFDGLDKMLSKDSLRVLFNQGNSMSKSKSIKMYDWESVISKDKKDEYVTLWYREYWEDLKGNKDSADLINDLKMKDGKIIGLDEFTRKLH